MQGSVQICDLSYQADASVVTAATQFVVVVATDSAASGGPTQLDGGVAMPNALGAGQIMGIAQTIPTVALGAVAVRKLGSSWCVGYGTIVAGHHVAVHSNAGDVYDVEAAIEAAPGTAAVFNIVGTAESSTTSNGQLVLVWIAPCVVNVAAS